MHCNSPVASQASHLWIGLFHHKYTVYQATFVARAKRWKESPSLVFEAAQASIEAWIASFLANQAQTKSASQALYL